MEKQLNETAGRAALVARARAQMRVRPIIDHSPTIGLVIAIQAWRIASAIAARALVCEAIDAWLDSPAAQIAEADDDREPVDESPAAEPPTGGSELGLCLADHEATDWPSWRALLLVLHSMAMELDEMSRTRAVERSLMSWTRALKLRTNVLPQCGTAHLPACRVDLRTNVLARWQLSARVDAVALFCGGYAQLEWTYEWSNATLAEPRSHWRAWQPAAPFVRRREGSAAEGSAAEGSTAAGSTVREGNDDALLASPRRAGSSIRRVVPELAANAERGPHAVEDVDGVDALSRMWQQLRAPDARVRTLAVNLSRPKPFRSTGPSAEQRYRALDGLAGALASSELLYALHLQNGKTLAAHECAALGDALGGARALRVFMLSDTRMACARSFARGLALNRTLTAVDLRDAHLSAAEAGALIELVDGPADGGNGRSSIRTLIGLREGATRMSIVLNTAADVRFLARDLRRSEASALRVVVVIVRTSEDGGGRAPALDGGGRAPALVGLVREVLAAGRLSMLGLRYAKLALHDVAGIVADARSARTDRGLPPLLLFAPAEQMRALCAHPISLREAQALLLCHDLHAGRAEVRTLHLRSCSYGDHVGRALVDVLRAPDASRLSRLDISDCNFSAGVLDALAAAARARGRPLETMHAGGWEAGNTLRVHVKDPQARCLALELSACMRARALVALELRNSMLSCAGAEAIAVALDASGVVRIDLSLNSIGDAGAHALARALRTMPRLRELSLAQNLIGCAGASALARACVASSPSDGGDAAEAGTSAARVRFAAEPTAAAPELALELLDLRRNSCDDDARDAAARAARAAADGVDAPPTPSDVASMLAAISLATGAARRGRGALEIRLLAAYAP